MADSMMLSAMLTCCSCMIRVGRNLRVCDPQPPAIKPEKTTTTHTFKKCGIGYLRHYKLHPVRKRGPA